MVWTLKQQMCAKTREETNFFFVKPAKIISRNFQFNCKPYITITKPNFLFSFFFGGDW